MSEKKLTPADVSVKRYHIASRYLQNQTMQNWYRMLTEALELEITDEGNPQADRKLFKEAIEAFKPVENNL